MKQLLGLGNLSGLFPRRNPLHLGKTILARLLSHADMQKIPYATGMQPENRDGKARQMAVGVWMVPVISGKIVRNVAPIRAVTFDVRSEGFGLLTTENLNAPSYYVALPDEANALRYLHMTTCHVTARPGGWYQIGLKIAGICDSGSRDLAPLREFINQQLGNSDSD